MLFLLLFLSFTFHSRTRINFKNMLPVSQSTNNINLRSLFTPEEIIKNIEDRLNHIENMLIYNKQENKESLNTIKTQLNFFTSINFPNHTTMLNENSNIIFPLTVCDSLELVPIFLKQLKCNVCCACQRNQICTLKCFFKLKQLLKRHKNWQIPKDVTKNFEINYILKNILIKIRKNMDMNCPSVKLWMNDKYLKHLLDLSFILYDNYDDKLVYVKDFDIVLLDKFRKRCIDTDIFFIYWQNRNDLLKLKVLLENGKLDLSIFLLLLEEDIIDADILKVLIHEVNIDSWKIKILENFEVTTKKMYCNSNNNETKYAGIYDQYKNQEKQMQTVKSRTA